MKKIFFLFLILGIHLSLCSQNNTPKDGNNNNDQVEEIMPFQNIIPPGPNAASLGSYGETPVSLFNGRPDISIPLWTVETNSISLPISLSYDAGGLKVAQVPSWVGAGWCSYYQNNKRN